MTWEERDRLLLAPLGKALLCAAFPEKGNPKRPTPQPPRKVRTVTRKADPQKKEGSQKEKEKRSREKPRPYPATTSKSSNDRHDGQYPETLAQSTITLQQPLSEQSQMSATVSNRAACLSPAPRGMLDAHEEQLGHRQMGTGTAGCMADPSILNLDAIDVPELYEYVNFDGYGD